MSIINECESIKLEYQREALSLGLKEDGSYANISYRIFLEVLVMTLVGTDKEMIKKAKDVVEFYKNQIAKGKK
jgi:hypothetical protein